MNQCPTGKRIMDKRTAVTLRNLTLKKHHIVMKEYHCPKCQHWHLTTIRDNKKKKFGHAHMWN